MARRGYDSERFYGSQGLYRAADDLLLLENANGLARQLKIFDKPLSSELPEKLLSTTTFPVLNGKSDVGPKCGLTSSSLQINHSEF